MVAAEFRPYVLQVGHDGWKDVLVNGIELGRAYLRRLVQPSCPRITTTVTTIRIITTCNRHQEPATPHNCPPHRNLLKDITSSPFTFNAIPLPLLFTVNLRLLTSLSPFTTAPAALISPLVPSAIAPLTNSPSHPPSFRPLQQPRFHRTMAADAAPLPQNRTQQSPLASQRDSEAQATATAAPAGRFGGPMFPLGYKESLGQWVCLCLSLSLAPPPGTESSERRNQVKTK